MGTHKFSSVADWMQHLTEESNVTCTSCSEKMDVRHQFLLPLPFIALDFTNQELQISHTFCIEINNQECVYKLHGIVYYGDSHFTACVISNNDMVWYHQGGTSSLKIAWGRKIFLSNK